MKLDAIIERYVKLRDKKAEIEARHKDELAPVKQALEKIENVLLSELNQQGVESVKTPFGTAYKSVSTSVTVADWDTALPWIQQNDAWHMLEKRVNKTAVLEHQAANDELPPGLNFSQATTINVRRS